MNERGLLERWLRDPERQMWVHHGQRQAVSFAAAQEMKIGSSVSLKIVEPLTGKDGALATRWYSRHYPRAVLMDLLLDARAGELVGSRG